MEVITDDDAAWRPPRPSAITIGAYDGLHLGHRHVIAGVRDLAAARDLTSVVVTFDRHPASVVRPESAPKLLTDLAQKLELLATTGIDAAVVIRFDEARAAETADDFVSGTLVERLRASVVSVGEDFHFGNKRAGNVELLRSAGAEAGFEVSALGLVPADGSGGRPVSSTAIRTALGDGRIDDANAMLGRPHEVRGQVVGGDKRGRELGFPTANVAVPGDICLPADGIYAGWYERPDGEVWPTAISLGRRPTFYEEADQSLLEAHLLDFSGDLYGEPARVRFAHRLRGEVRFDGVDALVAQIRIDCDDARRLLRGD